MDFVQTCRRQYLRSFLLTQTHHTTHQHRPNIPACTPTHGPIDNNVTKHSDLPRSFTVVMLVLDSNAALNTLKPASVTLSKPV